MVNINKLRGKIVERGVSVKILAEKLGMDRSTLYRRLSADGSTFTIGEADTIVKALHLSSEEASAIFLPNLSHSTRQKGKGNMKPCLRLRQKMLERDCSNTALARAIHRCPAYVSEALCAKTLLDSADIYAIAKLLEIPPEEWGEIFFPPEVRQLLEAKIKERGTR